MRVNKAFNIGKQSGKNIDLAISTKNYHSIQEECFKMEMNINPQRLN